MSISRRTFVAGVTAGALAGPLDLSAAPGGSQALDDRFDPWLEVDPSALVHNVAVVARLSGGRPILAVLKNNAYGLGLVTVARILEGLSEVQGFAVVKTAAALELREAGVRKPVLLMGQFADGDAADLVASGVELSLTTDDSVSRAVRAGRQAGRPVAVHAYLDTGMSRMGVPYHRALEWMEGVTASGARVNGTFMAFTEETDFDREQLRRFLGVVGQVRAQGGVTGALHAASSNGVFHLPEAHLDLVRPGIALYGAYPSDWRAERDMAELVSAVRLRARVVRVERLRPGDTVSYGRSWRAERPTWIATLPVGHADGYTRRAVDGAQVLIGGALYPVIGAVSASHSIIEVGEEPIVSVGDVATLVGPDAPEIHPNALAAATETSVYDVLMHLNPGMPRVVV